MIVTDDAGIIPLNQQCFGKDSATDVISFTYAPMPGDDPDRVCGEVHVNAVRALDVAGPDGAARELALYIAHGIDHLTGADDDTPARRRAMLKREQAWLDAAERDRLLSGLVTARRPSRRQLST